MMNGYSLAKVQLITSQKQIDKKHENKYNYK